MSLITAWHPKQSRNTDHACLDSLISTIHLPEEIEKIFEETGEILSPDEREKLLDLMRKHDLDRIPRDQVEYSLSDFDGTLVISDVFEDEHGDAMYTETSPIYDWIDDRIGTQVTILDENGEWTCSWEELNPEHEFANKFGPKSCKCKGPRKIQFDNGHVLAPCLDSIQISHDAHMWDLIPDGVQFNWKDGESTFLRWSDPKMIIIMKTSLWGEILKLCNCTYEIHDRRTVMF